MSKILEKITDYYRKNRWLIAFILFGPFMYAVNLYNVDMSPIDDFFEFARVFCFFAIVFIFFIIEHKKPSKLTIILFVLELWQFIATCLTNRKIVVAFYDFSSCLSIALLIELLIDDPKKLISLLMLHFELGLYPNFVDIIIRYIRDGNPGTSGLYLGGYTVQVLFFIPAIAVAMLYAYFNEKKFRSVMLLVITILSSYLIKNATTLVAVLTVIFVFVFGYFLTKKKNVSISVIFVIVMLADIFFVFIYGYEGFGFVKSIIENVLHRNMDFTGRIYIWPDEIELIKQHLFIGNGYRTSFNWVDPWGYGATSFNGHNQFLGKALSGGLIEVSIFLVLHFELFRKIEKQKPNFCKLTLVSCMAGIFATYITEEYFKFWRFYIVFFLLYHLEEIVKAKVAVDSEKE